MTCDPACLRSILPRTFAHPNHGTKLTNDNSPKSTPEASPSIDVTEWVDQFGDLLFRVATFKTGDPSIAEDLVQETFVSAVMSLPNFRNESKVSTWLFAILKRKIADHYRGQQRRSIESNEMPLDEVAEGASTSRRWRDDPSQICEDREFQDAFESCLSELPELLADAFILREMNERSARDTRELLGISATNLSMRLHRSRLALRDCLNKNWFGKGG